MEQRTNVTHPEESIWGRLARPFAFEEIRVKVLATNKDKTRGLIVPYIDARCVMDRLDEVVGPEAWSDEYFALAEGVIRCRLTVAGVSKEDVGLGDDPKSAFSDALKRAAVKFGLGRFLYDSEKLWGPLDDRGQIKDPEAAKRAVLGMGTKQVPRTNGHARVRRLQSSDELAVDDDLPF